MITPEGLGSAGWRLHVYFLVASDFHRLWHEGVADENMRFARAELQGIVFCGLGPPAILDRLKRELAADRAKRIERWRQHRNRHRLPAQLRLVIPSGDVVPFRRKA